MCFQHGCVTSDASPALRLWVENASDPQSPGSVSGGLQKVISGTTWEDRWRRCVGASQDVQVHQTESQTRGSESWIWAVAKHGFIVSYLFGAPPAWNKMSCLGGQSAPSRTPTFMNCSWLWSPHLRPGSMHTWLVAGWSILFKYYVYHMLEQILCISYVRIVLLGFYISPGQSFFTSIGRRKSPASLRRPSLCPCRMRTRFKFFNVSFGTLHN